MTEGVDFSWSRPGGAALAAAGKQFVVRYITGAGAKALSAAEIRDYRAHGLAIAVVFESTADRAKSGYQAGVNDAHSSLTAMAALGMPALPIYFAVDFNTTSANYSAIDDYLRGAASVLGIGRVGVYGEADLMAHCHAAGTARWFWQTYAWSGGAVFPGAHLLQYHNGQSINGATVDLCRALRSSYGQWVAPGEIQPPDTNTGEPMASAIRSEARTKASDSILRTKAGVTLYRDEGITKVRVLADETYLDDFGVPTGVSGFHAVGIQKGAFDNDVELEGGIALIRDADIAGGPRPKTQAELRATAETFFDIDAAIASAVKAALAAAPATPPPPDTTPFSQADLDAAKVAGATAEKGRIRSFLGL